MTQAPGLLLTLLGIPLAVLGLYLVILAIASMFSGGRPQESGQPRNRLVVLVPAHDEEFLIGRCVASLLAQSYPRDLFRVFVVADNCTDSTAAIASAGGAEVLVRNEPQARGKGQALRWAVDRLTESSTPFDAVIVVDADSVADSDMLGVLEAGLRHGNRVVQADYTVLTDAGSTPRSDLVAAAFLLFHRVRFSGRRRLGLPANLVGNGMLFGRDVLEKHPWSAFSGVEDLEYSIDLRMAGISVCYARWALIAGPVPTSNRSELRQRLRWEGGRFHVVRSRLWMLVRVALARRDPMLLDAALDLATPPLGLLVILDCCGLGAAFIAAATRIAPVWSLAAWFVALACIPAFVALGLLSARAPRRAWTAVLRAPVYVAWKLVAYLSLIRGFDPHRWDRSDRGDGTQPCRRIEIAGVPVDMVDMKDALQRVRDAIGGAQLFQVSTINLDFLVRAQKDPEVRRIFRRTDLNLADGAPVVWLSRVLGAHLPGRVAGADLVPKLVGELAGTGARLFLLGGEGGVAAEAAANLARLYPKTVIAGTYEPPRAAVRDLDNREILERIAASRADVLLVALGHPKQELWIDLHRNQLSVSVAIGVGCVLDLIAGRSTRAPQWMQALGLEWLYRLALEPRRLAGRYLTDAAWLLPLTASVIRSRVVAGRVAETA